MPRPLAGIVEPHLDHFDIRVTLPDGSRSKRACMPPTMTREEAKAEAARLTAIAWRGRGQLAESRPTGETMSRWMERWLQEREDRGIRSAHDDRGRWSKWLEPHLGRKGLADVQPSDLETLVEDLDRRVRAGELSWKTARHAWGVVTKAFDDAHRSKVAALRARSDNPAKEVRGPDRGAPRAKAYLYPDELLALANAENVPLRWRQLFVLAVYTYTRPGELEALQWGDVDSVRRNIFIHRAVDADGEMKPTKTKITRRIPIEPALAPLLDMLREHQPPGASVVTSMPPECDLSEQLRVYLRRVGVSRPELFADDATRKQITFYDLRATGITWQAIRGDDPMKIMARAGHADFKTTMGYVREAESIAFGAGDVFPPLPPAVLVSPRVSPDGPRVFGQRGGLARKYSASPAGFEQASPAASPQETGDLGGGFSQDGSATGADDSVGGATAGAWLPRRDTLRAFGILKGRALAVGDLALAQALHRWEGELLAISTAGEGAEVVELSTRRRARP